jgi:hypothetical protein
MSSGRAAMEGWPMQANNVFYFPEHFGYKPHDNTDEKPNIKYFYVTSKKHPKFNFGERVSIVRFESGTIIARTDDGTTGSVKEFDIITYPPE